MQTVITSHSLTLALVHNFFAQVTDISNVHSNYSNVESLVLFEIIKGASPYPFHD